MRSGWMGFLLGALTLPANAAVEGFVQGTNLTISVEAGSYSLQAKGLSGAILRSEVSAEVNGANVSSSAYPKHVVKQADFRNEFGSGTELTVTHTGLAGKPDLVSRFSLYRDQNWAEMETRVVNTTERALNVASIHSVHVTDQPIVNLNGAVAADRILSDSYSEDRPQLAIFDIGQAPKGMHRAVGSQLIYNRKSGTSLFLGALTSDRLLTIFHLRERDAAGKLSLVDYEVEGTGTTEIVKEESLRTSPASQQVMLNLKVAPGESLSSERLMVAVGNDYHAQLETYGRVVGALHKARTTAPTPIGWWSWTAYYFGLSQGTADANARWLADNLKDLGYDYFHIDEGYQYARGEYTTSDARLFPKGIAATASDVTRRGLRFGLWTAPFEVSERAWVFEQHKDWLLHNAAGDLIRIGHVINNQDPLYVLDVTHPEAQKYLRRTYETLRGWGMRFLKMDFMDDSAVEGAYYKANTTALQAQRLGLGIIREAVGDEVLLDKDGSPMLNPVGLVDAGRISQDTGHTFEASRDAASGIAARYYMNRTFFISDPDAFTVSTQTVDDQSWHEGGQPLTLDEARVSIALAAVAGGMFEIGDDLPTLGDSAERMALLKNTDLLDMARLGHASTPMDLLTYPGGDTQPSVFLLKESARQAILTVFNWTEGDRSRSLNFKDLGLKASSAYDISDVLAPGECCRSTSGGVEFLQKRHSVRVIKLIDKSMQATMPTVRIESNPTANAGDTLSFKVLAAGDAPALYAKFTFGDGSSTEGLNVRHAFSHTGNYSVEALVTGLSGMQSKARTAVTVTGEVATRFIATDKQRGETGN